MGRRLQLGYAIGVIGFLAFLQIRGFVGQFTHGFRPFQTNTTRQNFSWDMFSIPIVRCDVSVDPPVTLGGVTIHRLRDLSPGFEWDIVGNDVGGYIYFGSLLCDGEPGKHVFTLTCANPNGTVTKQAIACLSQDGT